jgi:hypothetical protein
MVVHEFRVPLPLSVAEFAIGQMHMVRGCFRYGHTGVASDTLDSSGLDGPH